MSMYEDIYNDFPLRCYQVWQAAKSVAQGMEPSREVTLMLMAAAGGLAMPHEHIKIESKNKTLANHPAFYKVNPRKYDKALRIINNELEKPITSLLFEKIPSNQLFLAYVPSEDKIRAAFEERRDCGPVKEQINSRKILKTLRNALCHSNLVALGDKREEIGLLGFYDQQIKRVGGERSLGGFNLVAMNVNDFAIFLENWFTLLKRISEAQQVPLTLVLTNAFEPDDDKIAA
jgi:hypothetical protein